MLLEDQIQEIADELANLAEKLDKDKKDAYIDPMYYKRLSLYESVKVHSQLDEFPYMLITESAPHETDEEFEYKKNTYQPVTRPIWKEATTQANRVFNKQNYSVSDWGNNKGIYEDQSAFDYFTKYYPEFGSIENFFKNVVKYSKDEDPNAIIALDFTEIDLDDTELMEPIMILYNSPNVILNEKEYKVLLSHKNSIVEYRNKKEEIGYIFLIYDDTNIWKVTQIGLKKDYQFEVELYYEHGLNQIPAHELMGQPKVNGSKMYYESLFADAIPNLNDALIDATNLRVNKVANLFMERIEWVDECDFEGCESGYILSDDGERSTCPSCHGEGKRGMMSPLGVTQIQVPNRLNDSQSLPFDPVTYVSKDPSMIESLRKEINEAIEVAFRFMGIEISMDKKSGNETATGKLIDRENLFSFLTEYSNQIFQLMAWSIMILGRSRYEDFQQPKIKKPSTFALRSESDLSEELRDNKELPDAVKAEMTRELLDIRFGDNDKLKNTLELKEKIDNYYLMSPQDVMAVMASGILPRWKAVLHFSFDSYINQKGMDFWEKDFEAQRQELENQAKEETIANTLGSTQNILGGGANA